LNSFRNLISTGKVDPVLN